MRYLADPLLIAWERMIRSAGPHRRRDSLCSHNRIRRAHTQAPKLKAQAGSKVATGAAVRFSRLRACCGRSERPVMTAAPSCLSVPGFAHSFTPATRRARLSGAQARGGGRQCGRSDRGGALCRRPAAPLLLFAGERIVCAASCGRLARNHCDTTATPVVSIPQVPKPKVAARLRLKPVRFAAPPPDDVRGRENFRVASGPRRSREYFSSHPNPPRLGSQVKNLAAAGGSRAAQAAPVRSLRPAAPVCRR